MTTLLTAISLCLAALATIDPISEIEPNQTRQTATPAVVATGGSFTGTCRGFVTDAASTGDDTRDQWRVTLTANPALIQRHRLQLTTSGTQGHTGSVIGVQASTGVVDPASMVTLQSTSINTVPARYSMVYTLGNPAPSFLYRVTGSSGTTSPYTVSVTTETVAPVELTFPCPLVTGPITITTVGRTTLNTKVLLFDGETFAPIPGAVNDDTPASASLSTGSPQSTLVRTLAPGRYLLAIGNADTVDDRTPPADDRAATQLISYQTESPGLIVNNSSTTTGDFSFRLSDAFGNRDVTASKVGSYSVAFYRFTVTAWCTADVGTTGGVTCHDGVLDNNDMIVYINAYFTSNFALADVGATGGVRGPDGQLDNNDWIVYLDQYFTGC